tara:strand:- start:8016 stop:8525 length:510 start_codon:yes stop_codon:yes gene_type:complete
MSIEKTAFAFATAAHYAVGQKRKYSGDDYIVHPIRVAQTVKQFGGNDDMVAAAYLHDVVEDTQVNLDIVTGMFGSVVGKLVDDLTDVSVPSDGNRVARKAIDREHLANASTDAQFIKCADIIDNSSDIADNDPAFWKVYKQEMQLLLDVMTKVKNTDIWNKAKESVDKG